MSEGANRVRGCDPVTAWGHVDFLACARVGRMAHGVVL